MEKLNEVHVETPRGLRSVELVHGDICDVNEGSDVLVISAFSTSYTPTPGTLIGALHHRHGLSVADLAERPQIDLREPLGCWISPPLSGMPFRRLLCVLGTSTRSADEDEFQQLEQRIVDVFKAVAVLKAWDDRCRTLVMPLLGAGAQGLDPAKAAAAIIRAAQSMLTRSLGLKRVRIVEHDWAKAQLLGDALDDELGRNHVALGASDLAQQVRQMVVNQIDRLDQVEGDGELLVSELARLLGPSMTAWQLGNWCRRFVEFVAHEYPSAPPPQEGNSMAWVIQQLKVPEWQKNHLHTLRIAGNRAAHIQRQSVQPDSADILFHVLAIHQVLAQWRRYRGSAE